MSEPELARVIDLDDRGCTLAIVDDGRIEHATLSDDIRRHSVTIQAGQLVLVAEGVVVFRGSLETPAASDLDRLRERYVAAWQARALRHASAGDPRQVVADGYNRIAERYAQWTRDEVIDEARPRYLSLLLDSLPPGADLLELGCGSGGPTTSELADRFRLTGVDISERQIELAEALVPSATFVCADMTHLALPTASFDAVASFYAFNHLPFGELPNLLIKIADWLRSRGLLVAALSRRYDPGTVVADWLGAPMYFSGYSPEESQALAVAAGLSIVTMQAEPIIENGHPTEFLWLVARKP
jgi:SAM-dependent methyltransferase